MRDIEDLGSAIVVKVQDTQNYKSRSSLILSKLQVPTTREVEITSGLKFEDCTCRKRKINK
jgi:hypothetical protein